MSKDLMCEFDGYATPKCLINERGEYSQCGDICTGNCDECQLQKVFDKLAAYEAKERGEVVSVSVEPDEPKTHHNLRLSVEFKEPISFDEAKERIFNAINPVLKG